MQDSPQCCPPVPRRAHCSQERRADKNENGRCRLTCFYRGLAAWGSWHVTKRAQCCRPELHVRHGSQEFRRRNKNRTGGVVPCCTAALQPRKREVGRGGSVSAGCGSGSTLQPGEKGGKRAGKKASLALGGTRPVTAAGTDTSRGPSVRAGIGSPPWHWPP